MGHTVVDELHELLKREKEQNTKSSDSDPAVDAYLKANAASTPDHIATEVSIHITQLCMFEHVSINHASVASCALRCQTLQLISSVEMHKTHIQLQSSA